MDSRQSVRPRVVGTICRSVARDLEKQHDWRSLEIVDGPDQLRPLIRGLPPQRLYLHPDDQVLALASEHVTGGKLHHQPEFEWVLPLHLSEAWSLANFATVFKSVTMVDSTVTKRVLLAIVHSDSTVVYYIMHQGIVKPRQN
ncbi:hypothetical protein CDD80_4898 [Ophiocordyceps camponoti-rufipedis]|uniref:tRNA-splicing endonuclease subunit Sen15 domain-containing protein n=1 Tax=Ophiocordyceps camponoti-rufipedis TaxID=2004952 RepID=A0A2C5YWM7_9HYPO|nr:hypothetical protein CDD80_4898 [Ophiocordyceps camponoti-rufipedis]